MTWQNMKFCLVFGYYHIHTYLKELTVVGSVDLLSHLTKCKNENVKLIVRLLQTL